MQLVNDATLNTLRSSRAYRDLWDNYIHPSVIIRDLLLLFCYYYNVIIIVGYNTDSSCYKQVILYYM